MSSKLTIGIAFGAAMALTGCAADRYQAPKNTSNTSENVILSSKGKKMKLIGAIPTRIEIDRNNSDLARYVGKSECQLKSTTFTATTKIGKTLNLPSYGRQTPPMSISCELGKTTLTKEVAAVNRTEQAYKAEAVGHVFIGFGILGAAVSAGQAANRDKSKDIYGYPQQITLED